MSEKSEVTTAFQQKSRSILVSLFFPVIALLFNGSVFSVALPTIRDHFLIDADIVAWLAIAYSLPFMVLMPLYGRLGDQLGKSRLLIFGVAIMAAGTGIILLANSLTWVFVGRVVQGVGSSSVTPLCLSIISSRFPPEERGRALGIWNATAPGTSIFAPSIGGFLVDSFGWRSIFIPVAFICILTIFIVRWQIPPLRGKPNWQVLRHFDWSGVILLNGTVLFLVLYLSSRPVTGIEPLQDWRLLLGFLLFTAVFFFWESRQEDPLVDLKLLRIRTFSLASLTSGFRMAMMVGPNFLFALYLADLYQMTASIIGLFASIHSVILFIFIRIGGNSADKYSNRNLIVGGLAVQLTAMIYFSLLPADMPVFALISGMVVHGLGAGLCIVPMHRKALGSVDDSQSGAAAGIYSMTRFGGSMIATTLIGVVLQFGEIREMALILSYQMAFGVLVLFGIAGVIFGLGIPKTKTP